MYSLFPVRGTEVNELIQKFCKKTVESAVQTDTSSRTAQSHSRLSPKLFRTLLCRQGARDIGQRKCVRGGHLM